MKQWGHLTPLYENNKKSVGIFASVIYPTVLNLGQRFDQQRRGFLKVSPMYLYIYLYIYI